MEVFPVAPLAGAPDRIMDAHGVGAARGPAHGAWLVTETRL